MKSKTRIFLLFSAFILLKKSPAGYPKIRHKKVEIKDNFKDTKIIFKYVGVKNFL